MTHRGMWRPHLGQMVPARESPNMLPWWVMPKAVVDEGEGAGGKGMFSGLRSSAWSQLLQRNETWRGAGGRRGLRFGGVESLVDCMSKWTRSRKRRQVFKKDR